MSRSAPLLATGLLCLGLAGCAGGNSQASEGPAEKAKAEEEEGKPAAPPAAPVEVATLARGPMEAVLRYSADLEAEQAVPVHSQSPQLRRVVQLLVEEGARVGRGQLLAKLQDDEQRHGMARVQGNLAKARSDFERQKRLFGQVMLWFSLVLAQTVTPVVIADAVDEDHGRREGHHHQHDGSQRVDGHADFQPLALEVIAQRQPIDGAGNLSRVFFQRVEIAQQDIERHRPAHDQRTDDGHPGNDPAQRPATVGNESNDEKGQKRHSWDQPGHRLKSLLVHKR